MVTQETKKKGMALRTLGAHRWLVAIVSLCLAASCIATYSIINAYAAVSDTTENTGNKNTNLGATGDATIGYLNYTFGSTSKTASVVGYDSTNFPADGKVKIPSSVTYNDTTYDVTTLGSICFGDCTALTSVIIPDSVTTLGSTCFGDCTALTSVTIPDSVTSLGNYCFERCTSLTSITILGKVTSVPKECFSGCTSLTSVTIPNSVTSLYRTFTDCTSLVNITIPNSVTALERECFSGCTSLASITIPDNVTILSSKAFDSCTALKEIVFEGSSIESCQTDTFSNGPSDRKYIFESTVPNCFATISHFTDTNTYYRVKFLSDSGTILQQNDVQKQSIIDAGTSIAVDPPSSPAASEITGMKFKAWDSDAYKSVSNSGMVINALYGLVSLTDERVYVEIDSQPYTGSQIKPSFKVFFKEDSLATAEELIQDTSYTILEYGENKNVNTGGTIKIEGKGAYEGELTISFNITAKNIATDATIASIAKQPYTGDPIEPEITITDNTTAAVLEKDKDYEIVSFENNTDVGTAAKVNIKGISNYSGTTSATFEIFNPIDLTKNIADTNYFTVTAPADQTYSGSALTPEPTITEISSGKSLEKDKDYKLDYTDNLNAGNASVVITAIGDTYYGETKTGFSIAAKDIATGATIAAIENQVYTGSAIEPELTITDNDSGAKLKKGKDYSVTCLNNTNVGTAFVVVAGAGNYKNQANTSFKIVGKDIAKTTNIDPMKQQTYTGSAIEIDPVITDAATAATLEKGKDYTLNYANNKNVGEAFITVTGIGNYSGQTIVKFDIIAKDITTGATLASISDQKYTGSAITPTITLTDATTGATLTPNTDYQVLASNNINVGIAKLVITGTGNWTGQIDTTFNIIAKDIATDATIASIAKQPYTGDPIEPKITITDNTTAAVLEKDKDYEIVSFENNTDVGTAAKVNIKGISNYSGTTSATFEIFNPIDLTKNIADTNYFTVTAPADQTYSGSALTPEPTITEISSGKSLEKDKDYKLDYTDNLNAGNASVVITAIGDTYYGETKTGFSIAAKSIANAKIASIPNQPYTGSEIEPKLSITDEDRSVELTKGTDYTVVFAKNKDIGTADVTVDGTGNYTGQLTTSFEIVDKVDETKDISKTEYFILKAPADQTYNGSPLQPDVTLTEVATGQPLTKDTDYTLTYANNTEVGTATITITGNGDYYGQTSCTFEIVQKQSEAKDIATAVTIVPIPNQPYTGSEIEPPLTIIDNDSGVELVKGQDYSATYFNNINVGPAFVLITGIGNYKNQTNTSFEIVSKIDETKDVSKAEYFTVKAPDTQPYTGSALTPEPIVTEISSGKVLEKDTDYTLTYTNNIKVGTATIIITGKGSYCGQTSCTFEIVESGDDSKDITDDKYFSVTSPASQAYTGSALTPDPYVIELSSGKRLVNGTDYTTTYSNNTEPGTATITVTGIEDYKGEKTCTFQIIKNADEEKDISKAENFIVSKIENQVFTGSPICPEPFITEVTTGNALVKGTDYELTYSNNVNIGTATIYIVSKGNTYTGAATTTFEIVATGDDSKDIAGDKYFKVTPPDSQKYTGSALTPDPVVVELSVGKRLVKDTDYILAYANNTEPGTATITVTGKGDYKGEKTCTFQIVKDIDENKDISKVEYFSVESVSDQKYTGSPICPEPKVTEVSTGNELVKDTDYELAYSDNVNIGTATVYVVAKGDIYTGTATTTFEIVASLDPTPTEISWDRLAGGSALTTMKAIVNEGWENSVEWAVVATSQTYQDALSASALAGLLNSAPVLLTPSNELSNVTKNLLINKNVKKVIIVGGTAAISAGVETAIQKANNIQTIRIAGGTATTTATAIYKWGKDTANTGGITWGSDAIVATIDSYQDALSIAPYAYAKHAPIFLTDKGTKDIRLSVQGFIKDGGFNRTLIIGGEKAVSQAVEDKVTSLAERLAGGSAYTTSKAVANFALSNGMTSINTSIACGTTYQDALTGAALCGSNNSIILLADDNKAASQYKTAVNIVKAQKDNLQNCYIFGGVKAVSENVETAIKEACQ